MSEAVEAVLRLLETDRAVGEILNIGNDEEITMERLAELVKARIPSPSPIEKVSYEQAYKDGFEDMP